MTTELKEHYDLLYKIQSENPPSTVILAPSSENMYEINLNTREVTAPPFVGVSEDHSAEIIYFKVPRFYEGVDLSQTACVINFINAGGERKTYPVPFYDIDTLGSKPNSGLDNFEIIIPWIIKDDVTKYSGNVSFAFNFFHIKDFYVVKEDGFNNNLYEFIDGEYKLTNDTMRTQNKTYYEKQLDIVYSLNTIPATTKVLTTVHAGSISSGENTEEALIKSANYLIEAIKSAQDQLDIYWEVL